MLDIIMDAFWGSCGKGKVADWWTHTRQVTDVVSGNMPNAGHTIVRDDKKIVAKVLPSAAFFNGNCDVWLSASSGFNEMRMTDELSWLRKEQGVHLHERAFEVHDGHSEYERNRLSAISSTMQGSAAALCDKILRINKRTHNPREGTVEARKWRTELLHRIETSRAMFEVAQGWGLSIDHGTQYPNCTSRNCSAQRALDDCACPTKYLGDVIAVIRPYPIRVGNTTDGYSGDFMPDCTEVDWAHVKSVSGVTDDLEERERTTVTKRIRRVSTFSFELLADCVRHNGVSGIFLNFAQYIDSSCAGKRGKFSDAPTSVRIFADAIEDSTECPVIALGTGADTFDVLEK